jgi:1-acyl-sn-glycerol-3-phosphate acyltransferase
MRHSTNQQNSDQTAQCLIELLQDLVAELHPENPPQVTLESRLDRDLGLDSMARMELLGRMEKRFDSLLSEQVLAEAETPHDLLQALLGTAAEKIQASTDRIEPLAASDQGEPQHAATLVEVLEWHLHQHPDRPQVQFYVDEGDGESISYRQLWDGASAVAAGLQWQGLEPGSAVAIMLPTSADYLYSFFGILLAGCVPVPLYPPVRRTQLENHLRRQQTILANCEALSLITLKEALPFARVLKGQLSALQGLVTVDELRAQGQDYVRPDISADDTAFLQYTSGSTGNPKGVVLSHANLLANIRALGKAVEVHSDDVIISWLPLYHDMGLIGTWLAGLYFATPVVLLSPLDFLSRPKRWLWAIHRYRGTLSPAPNFAYEICLTKIDDDDLKGLDLSSWRGAFNGAEPVSAHTIERFCKRFAAYGLRPEAMAPVYGLAECTVGLAFPPLGRPPLIDRVSRKALTESGKAVPAKEDEENVLHLVACGRPLEGHEIRIVDAAGRELPERQEGRIQFRGPSASSGYYRNPEETRRLFDGDWLNTGDLGYLAEGDLYLTGRSKDLIIIGGRNIHPQELEAAVGTLSGVRKGNVAVFGSPDPASGSERLVIVAEVREMSAEDKDKLQSHIKSLAVDLLDTPPDDVLLVPPHSVLKTSSGKIRRTSCRDLYERGQLGKDQSAWQQTARLALFAVLARWREGSRTAVDALYAGYLWSLYGLAATLACLIILLAPRHAWNWKALHLIARSVLRLSGLPVRVEGLEHLPRGQPCTLVSNHASYLDAYLLAAVLPLRISFVAKSELRDRPIIGFLLHRIGAEFVERFDPGKSAEDARRIRALAQSGRNLLFFAEGTFTRLPGLRSFRLGAFIIAAESRQPLVPIAISGTRAVLRDGSWFPRRGPIRVQIGEPVQIDSEPSASSDDSWQLALRLRQLARSFIVRHCGEPDLNGTASRSNKKRESNEK